MNLTIGRIHSNALSLFVSGIPNILAASFILISPATQAASPFITEGKFSVGSDGSANYSIPIVVPPGTAGMQPQLALNYNSNGGNGIVGMGWGIDGLSQISRCGTTLEQDGVINGVNYTTTDRFCIDGQRLIATSDTYNTSTKQYSTTSAYGANGTEYRTESANFAKIISYGTAGTGPAYFKVWTKSGQIIEYGNTADSAIEAQGKPTIRTWGVNKISDTKGNYITVSYTEDNANGEAYVSRIDYTGNTASTPALTPYANIQFIYETRPDTTTVYQAGSVLKTTKRLTSIQGYNGTALIKSYKLTYSNTGAYHTNTSNVADGTLLASVQECDGSATPVCKQATSLTWVPGTVSTNPFAGTQGFGLPTGSAIIASGDVNGDGIVDVIYNIGSGNTITSYLAFSNGSSFVNVSVLATATSTTTCTGGYSMAGCNSYTTTWSGSLITSAFLTDINGDGLADLVLPNSVRISNGTGLNSLQNWGVANVVAVGDVNGDGKSDVIYNTTSGNTMTSYIAFSNGASFISPIALGSSTSTQTCSGHYTMAGCEGSIIVTWSGSAILGGYLADMNGDGKADLVGSTAGGVRLSTGIGFGASQNWGFSQIVAIGDVNGDGMADIVHNYTAGSNVTSYLAISNGLTVENVKVIGSSTINASCSGYYSMSGCVGTTTTSWSGSAMSRAYIGDMNRDGMADLFSSSGYNSQLSQPPDQLTTLTSGGVVNGVVYNKLSTSGLYVADASSSYPIRDISTSYPIYVVSSATVSDGVGGVVTTNYQYGGLKAHLRGRGSLGFRYVKESSPDSGLSVTTFYRQDFPFIGLPSQVEKRRLSDNALLSVVQNTYANSDLATSTMLSKFPYLSQSVEQAYELDGSLVSTTTTTNQYDGYGNVTSVSVDDGLGNTKTTTSTYSNDVGNWLLGRLLRSTVTSNTP